MARTKTQPQPQTNSVGNWRTFAINQVGKLISPLVEGKIGNPDLLADRLIWIASQIATPDFKPKTESDQSIDDVAF